MGYLCGLKYRIMKEKTIQIIVPEGYEVDKEKSSFEKIVFRALRDELPKKWEELGSIGGYWIEDGEEVVTAGVSVRTSHISRGTFPSKEEAEASIALAQLCQLRDRYNGGWKPDWSNSTEVKYCIYFTYGKVTMTPLYKTHKTLRFYTRELADEFMENFSDLIEKAKPLLG